MCKRICAALAILAMLCMPVYAQETEVAQRVSIHIDGTGYKSFDFLTDGNEFADRTSDADCTLTITSQKPFQSLYIRFDLECDAYVVTDILTGQSVEAGQYGMLHEYVTLPEPTTSATVAFTSPVQVTEITAYSAGQTPENVQVWEPVLEGNTDILLLSTHGDDEHLYFAGLLPLYAAQRGYRVQVAYLTPHRNPPTIRCHEMLNGLWAVGVRNYPVIGRFKDFRIDDLEASYRQYAWMGTSKEELLGYVVELYRRFDPQVVVGHDFNGEYGHGMHRIYADLLVQALEISNDPTAYPELAEKYGLWDVPKAYSHLYEENPIVIDYDTPLERFNGLSAFQVSQKYGFPCHMTQQNSMFVNWLYGVDGKITKATEIDKYNPAHFGLYRSTVGEDVRKNDFMENIVSYGELERLEQERIEAERLEAERLEAERLEQERLEAERLEQERLEAERKEQERLQQIEKAKQMAQQQAKRRKIFTIVLGALAVISAVFAGVLFLRKRKKDLP